MRSWLKRKFGITPELERKVREIERSSVARAAVSPFAVNRQVIVLYPLEKYFTWTNQWLSQGKVPPVPLDPVRDRWACSRAFLVSGLEHSRELKELVKQHRKYFMESYLNGHAPKSLWPWKPTEEEFSEWFEILIIGAGTWDNETKALSKEPDVVTAAIHEF